MFTWVGGDWCGCGCVSWGYGGMGGLVVKRGCWG